MNGWNTFREDVDIKIAHTNPTLVIVLTSSLDEHADNESFGFKNFQLLIDRCPENCDACANSNQQACLIWNMVATTWTKDADNNREGWDVSDGKDNSYTCAGINFYGSYGNFGKAAKVTRKFDLPPHYRIKIKALYFKLDSWDNEFGFIMVDTEKIWNLQMLWNLGYKLCGHPEFGWKGLAINVDAEVAHTRPIATVTISSTLDEAPDNESWGVRDFFMYIAKCSKSCQQCTGPNDSDCTKCQDNWAL